MLVWQDGLIQRSVQNVIDVNRKELQESFFANSENRV
jgi:hypothetical protein